MASVTPDRTLSKFSSNLGNTNNQHVSVIDIEGVNESEYIEEDIDVVDEGLLSPNIDNAINWQNAQRNDKPQTYCVKSSTK